MLNNKILLIFLFVITLFGHILFSEENINPNEISDYYRELINSGIINPLSMLKINNERIFNIIYEFIPEDEIIENYYYQINFNIFDINTGRQITVGELTIEENGIIILPNDVITNIEYIVYYYQIFLNRNSGWRGDPTGKCFSVIINENTGYIRKYFWR
jgi:hypothetical protein